MAPSNRRGSLAEGGSTSNIIRAWFEEIRGVGAHTFRIRGVGRHTCLILWGYLLDKLGILFGYFGDTLGSKYVQSINQVS